MVSEIIYYCIVTTSMHLKLLPIHSNLFLFFFLTERLCFLTVVFMFAELLHGSSSEENLKRDLRDGCSRTTSGTMNMKPSFTKKLTFQSVLEGEPVELQCELVASPPPSILWFHNNKTFRKTRRRRICSDSQLHMHTTSLVIDRVKEKDAGSYKVMAINHEGSAESTASLLVSMQEEQSANHLSCVRHFTKAQECTASSSEHGQERKFRVDLRCVGSPFDRASKARLGRSRSETSLVRSVYFRSGSHSKERASAGKSKPLETASERALSPPPMFDRSERFNDRFSDIYCDRRTGARSSDRFSDRFSDTESLHNEVRTKLSTLQKAVQQRKRFSISTMSSSEFELESAASESNYADYVERLRLRPAFPHDVPHFNPHLDSGDSQQEFQSKTVRSGPSQCSMRHSFEPQSRTRAIQVLRGELVDQNAETFMESQKDDDLKEEVSKPHAAVAGGMMEDSFYTVKEPYPEVPHSESSFYPQTTVYPECGESGPVFISQEEVSLMEAPTPKEVTTLPAGFTEAAAPEDKVDSGRTEFVEEESFKSPGGRGPQNRTLEYDQIGKWQQGSKVSKEELSYHDTGHPYPTKRVVKDRESVGTETVPEIREKFGDPEAGPTTKSPKTKASFLEEEARIKDRVEETEFEPPVHLQHMSPRLNIKPTGLQEQFLPKGKAKEKDIPGDSPRPSKYKSTKERFLNEPELPTHIPSDTCEPSREPCGGESLRAEYGKSLEAERVQCEEKLLALRIRKWQQGMQMSDETHYPETDLTLEGTSNMESEGHIYSQQKLRRSSAEHTESQKHPQTEPPPKTKPRAEKMLVETGEEHALHLSRDNISGLKHDSGRFFSEEEALAQRIIQWQQDVLNEQEQAAELESSRTGAHAQIHREEGAQVSSKSLPQFNMSYNQKSSSAKSAKEKFFMSEYPDESEDHPSYCPRWVSTGQLQRGREDTLQRASQDSVIKDKALVQDIFNRQQDVAEKEHRAKTDSESQQHGVRHEPQGHSAIPDREDDLVGIAYEHTSVPSLLYSAHASKTLPLKSSILHAAESKPPTSTELEDVRVKNRQKEALKVRSQHSRDEINEKEIREVTSADRDNKEKTSEGVSGVKGRMERHNYGPKKEEVFVKESTDWKVGLDQTRKSKKKENVDAGAGGAAPDFVRQISSLKAKMGEMSEFTCQFHGDPLPTVTWLKDGHPLTHNPDFDIVDRANKSKLTVFYPTADHEGTYDCVITNKHGEALCSATLEITNKTVARSPDFSKEVIIATDLHKRGCKMESVSEKELNTSVDSGQASLQVPSTVVHRQLCSGEGFSPSPVEIRITSASPVPGTREEDSEEKLQSWTEEVSTEAAAERSSETIKHKFTFSFDVAEAPSLEKESLSTTYSELSDQPHWDTAREEETTARAQPEEAVRTKKSKHSVLKDHPGISGCGLLASSAVINISELKHAFESDSAAAFITNPHKPDRKEAAFPQESIPAVAVSIEKDRKGETDPRSVDRDSPPRVSPSSVKTVPRGTEADLTQSSPASGTSASIQPVSPQLPAMTIVPSSHLSQPTSFEENSQQVSPETGAGSTEGHDPSKEVLEMVSEASELITPKKAAHFTKEEPYETKTGRSLQTFDRTSSFIPFLSEKEKHSGRTSTPPQATLNPKRSSGSLKTEGPSAVVMSSPGDSQADVVRNAVGLEELTEVKKHVKDQMEVDTDKKAVPAALEESKEASSACAELISEPEPAGDSGIFLSEPDTQPDRTKTAEEMPGDEGELDVVSSGAQERLDVHVKSDPQSLMVNPKDEDILENHLSRDGAIENKATSTQERDFHKSPEIGVTVATVGSLEEEEVTFGAVYDYYNLPSEWGRPMSPESEMSIEFGSTLSEEITEVAERFFTPGSSTEVMQPAVESFHTPTSPMTFHTPTSVTSGGFVTPREYPFSPAGPKSPSSRGSSERFFSPLETLSSPVAWSMETPAGSSSLATLEEKGQGVPPAFLKPLMKKRVCEGDSLTFFAEVFGLPSPEVKWFCNKTQLVEDDRVRMERDGDSISLTVLDVTKADQGEYICEAVNNVGEARSVALVVVVSQEMRLMPAPPAVTHQHVMEFDVEENDSSRSPSPQEILLEVELDENEVKEFEKQVKIITIPEYTADNKSMIVSLDVLPSIYEEGAVDFVTHEHDDLKIAFEVTEMPPRFINPICDLETPEGSTILFECSLMGTPSPVVSWFKGDKKIPHNSKKYVPSFDGDSHFLKICTVTTQDSGVYVCRAINVVGETLCRASLVVVNAQAFAGRTRGREVTAVSLRSAKIQPQKFDLMVGGTSFDGEQVSEIELEFEFDQEGDESQRAVRLVANAEHQSQTSEQGEKYVSVNFDVFAEPAKEEKVEFKGKSSDMCSFQFQVTESPPKFIIPLSNITAAVGTPVILQCLVSGTPNPIAEWYKDGDRVTDSRCIIQEKTVGHFNLLITNVSLSDAGEYKCITQNAAGCSESAALLKVF